MTLSPAGMSAVSAMLPLPLVAQVAAAVPAQAQVQVSEAGNVSETVVSGAPVGPALLTVIV